MLKWCIRSEISLHFSCLTWDLWVSGRTVWWWLAGRRGKWSPSCGSCSPSPPGPPPHRCRRTEIFLLSQAPYYITAAFRLEIKSDSWNLISPFIAFLFLDFDRFDNKIFYRSRSFFNTCWTPLVLGREGKSCWISLELLSRFSSLSSIPLSLNSLLLSWLTFTQFFFYN